MSLPIQLLPLTRTLTDMQCRNKIGGRTDGEMDSVVFLHFSSATHLGYVGLSTRVLKNAALKDTGLT